MKRILLLLSLLITFSNVEATHLMGGEITWSCIKSGPKTGWYVFEVKVYRDCQGIPISTTTNLMTHNIPGYSIIPLTWDSLNSGDISPTCNTINGPNNPFSCNTLNSGSGGTGQGAVEEHIYRSDTVRITGTPDVNGWHFTWSSCCRNSAVVNVSPGGFTLRAVMYSYTDSTGSVFPNGTDCYDSSPKFYEKPRTILEVGNGYDPLAFSNGFTYSHNAFDEEQDSISYEWGVPLDDISYDYLNPNSSAVSFLAPYTFTSPINGIVLNANTGRTFYPANQQGNYVTCTKASAYKCGQLVAEIYREVQIVLIPPTCNLGDTTNGNFGADTLCNTRPIVQPPFFYPGTPAPFQWDTAVHCGDTVAFEFIANDYDYYPNGSMQDLKFEVSGGQFYNYNANVPCQNPPCATFNELNSGATPPFITSGGSGTGYFEWITSCNHVINSCSSGPKPSVYTFVIKVQDDFCPAPAIENTSQVISITVYPPCGNIKANEVLTQATCGLSNGSATISPSGGFPPYTSYWFDMNGLPVNPNALSAGDYQLRITDVSLCELIDTITITSPNLFTTSISSTPPSCNNLADGTATVSTNFGSGYTYLWSNGASTQTISNLSAGVYSVIVTDLNGCSINDTLILTNPLALSATTSNTSISCFGDNSGSISVVVNNGIPPFNYNWNTGDTTQVINNLAAGLYSVTVSDSNNCSVTENINLTQPTQLFNDTLMTVVNSISCFGGNDGSINIYPIGGTPPYTFNWSNGSTTEDLSNLSSGTYTVIITDSLQCNSSNYSFLITEPAQITTNTTYTDVSCNGNSDGSIDLTVFGGISPYTFVWSNGATTEDISNLNAGNYSVTISDANNCLENDSVIINEPNVLMASLSSTNTSLTALASGGTTPYNYEVYGPNGFYASSLSNSGTSFTTNPLVSGTYTFIVTDANGCIDSTNNLFTFSSNFTPTVIVSLSNLVCNSLADLTIEVSQDSGEVDMSTALFTSNAGSFDISSMNNGDTIGTAFLSAAGGTLTLNTMIMVSSIINNNQAIIVACDSLNGCLGTFTINNTVGGGVSILTSSVPDGNNYTQGNMSSITFINSFINPCGPLTFTTTINSELGDVDNQSFNFLITSINNTSNYNFKIYPNPTNGNFNVVFNEKQQTVNIKIMDVLGKKIYYNNSFINILSKNISLENIPQGSYIVIIKTNNKIFSEVLIYQ